MGCAVSHHEETEVWHPPASGKIKRVTTLGVTPTTVRDIAREQALHLLREEWILARDYDEVYVQLIRALTVAGGVT